MEESHEKLLILMELTYNDEEPVVEVLQYA